MLKWFLQFWRCWSGRCRAGGQAWWTARTRFGRYPTILVSVPNPLERCFLVYPVSPTHLLLNVRRRTCLGCIVVQHFEFKPQIFHNISHKQEKDLRPWLSKYCKHLCNCSASISSLKLYHFRVCARMHSGRKWKSKKKNCTWDWVGCTSSRRGAGFNSFFHSLLDLYSTLLDRTKEELEEVPVHCQVLQIGLQTFKGVSPLCSATLVV